MPDAPRNTTTGKPAAPSPCAADGADRSGADLIVEERHRQIVVEGWTADHDVTHDGLDLLHAAVAYANVAKALHSQSEANLRRAFRVLPDDVAEAAIAEVLTDPLGDYYGRGDDGRVNPPDAPWARWPWAREDWKPSDDPVRNLVKAGALIAAEIDRLQAVRTGPCPQEAPDA